MSNVHETYARTVKAMSLAKVARQYGVTAAQVSEDDRVRTELVIRADVREPSIETWAMVTAILTIEP